ncbi:MAG: hypothetical protein Kow0099_34290 [Candidatus Abyssubacteria bacterium]
MRFTIPRVVLFLIISAAVWDSPAFCDMIKFKHGAQKKCVIIKEDEKWVTFLTQLGEMKMPRSRIESIERESDELNAALKEEWQQSKVRPQADKEEDTKAEENKPKTKRTYNVEVRKRRLALGIRGAANVGTAEAVAVFFIKDMGMVEGSRLFHVNVTSYKSGTSDISPANFYALTSNGARFDPRPLKGYEDLKGSLVKTQSTSGHVAFPTDAELEQLIVNSDLGNFNLNLATGDFVIKDSIF